MYKVFIEGETNEIETIEEVIDHVESNTCFEVDSYDLGVILQLMEQGETIWLRDDCAIYMHDTL